jgi:hypothetical protein
VIAPSSSAPAATAAGAAASRHALVLAEARAEAERLTGWLVRLHTYGDQAPRHVVQAVRADYTSRLQAVVERVGAMAEEARRRGVEARQRARDAAGRSLELRLRYLVGEIDPAGLERELARQEAVIASTADEDAESEAAAEAAEALLAELRMHAPDPAAPATSPAPTPCGRATVQEVVEDEDELAFLDRLPASSAPVAATVPGFRLAPERSQREAGRETRLNVTPRSLLSCRHCGTGNDPSLWYCDGCGAELS